MSITENKVLEWIKKYEKNYYDIDLIKLREILINFIINKDCYETCLKHLNDKERKYIHIMAGGCKLKTCSRGKKENRKIFIKKALLWEFDNTEFIYIEYHKSKKYSKYNSSLTKEENDFIKSVDCNINNIIGSECEKCSLKLTKENILEGFYLAYNLYKDTIFCCNCIQKMPMSPHKEELVGIYTEDLEKYKNIVNKILN